MKIWGWLLVAFAFGGLIGSHLTFRYMRPLADGWQRLYEQLKAEVRSGDDEGNAT